MTFSQLKIDILRFARDKNTLNKVDVILSFKSIYPENKINEFLYWLDHNGYSDQDINGKILGTKGLDLLSEIELEIERRKKEDIDLNKKILLAKWWDRFIDNGYKIIGIPILFWTAYLQYTQVGNSADIKRLQEKLKADSIQFSTTLRDIENQLIQHNKMLQDNYTKFEVYDSLFKSLKIEK